MKLRNKKTGEVGIVYLTDNGVEVAIKAAMWSNEYSSLAELNEDWEDYEEPKECDYWYIEADGKILQCHKPTFINHLLDGQKGIGNYFETKEEAEEAVEKLKAWKRLKDKGFRFKDWFYDVTYVLKDSQQDKEGWSNDITINAKCSGKADEKDLDLLFGGEE